LAEAWVKMPNHNRLFNGDTPLAYIESEGIVALQYVRALLEARCKGIHGSDRFYFLWPSDKNPETSIFSRKK
jgi:hypothetical protein